MKVISEEEVEVTDEFKGRIGAQTAKQVIFQKLRDAEREMTYEEFAGREGDVVTGIVQQQERRYTLLDLGKVEALLPQAEQVPSEPYRHGERLKAYITEVRKGTKGPQIVVSRSHPGLLKALFALEVPEIEEGIVEIKAVAREPGHRSKIAVSSNEPGVDPVGACVGPKGSRVRMVVNELRGEKIDVVPWSANPAELVANALQPAKVKEVRDRRGHEHRARHRARLPAVARDRQGRAERPPRRAADRLADRHQVRDAGRRRAAARACRCAVPRCRSRRLSRRRRLSPIPRRSLDEAPADATAPRRRRKREFGGCRRPSGRASGAGGRRPSATCSAWRASATETSSSIRPGRRRAAGRTCIAMPGASRPRYGRGRSSARSGQGLSSGCSR